MLPLLSDELLLEAYQHAVRLQLEREFLHLLRAEIRRRQLPFKEAGSRSS
ncbi:sporulation histidine kinase inhibitor Sda [Cohnella sp. 56]